jgi:hypothetical protein
MHEEKEGEILRILGARINKWSSRDNDMALNDLEGKMVFSKGSEGYFWNF